MEVRALTILIKVKPLIKKQKLPYTVEGALQTKHLASVGPIFISKWNSKHYYKLLFMYLNFVKGSYEPSLRYLSYTKAIKNEV